MDAIDYKLLFSGHKDYYHEDIYNLLISYLDYHTLEAFILTNKFIGSLFPETFWTTYVHKHNLELLLPFQHRFSSVRQFCLRALREGYYVVSTGGTSIYVFTDVNKAYQFVINEIAVEMARKNAQDITMLDKIFSIGVVFLGQCLINTVTSNHVIWSTSRQHKYFVNPKLSKYPTFSSDTLLIGSIEHKSNDNGDVISFSRYNGTELASCKIGAYIFAANSGIHGMYFECIRYDMLLFKHHNRVVIFYPSPALKDKYIIVDVLDEIFAVSPKAKRIIINKYYVIYAIDSLPNFETILNRLGAKYYPLDKIQDIIQGVMK